MWHRVLADVLVWGVVSLLSLTPRQAQAGQASQTVELGDEHFRVAIVIDDPASVDAFGPRFDRTARVKQVTLEGHTFLGVHGLADEFGITGLGVLGYDQAKVGDTFLKIGVGLLERDVDKRYKFDRPYPVKQWFPVASDRKSAHGLELKQDGALGDQRYHYLKRYDVDVEADTLTIAYAFTNTGTEAITFDQYNHNWFKFDGQPIGPSYVTTTDFTLAEVDADWLDQQCHRLAIKHVVEKFIHCAFREPFLASANRFQLTESASGLQVTVTGDFPATAFDYYGDPRGICPEVFYQVTVSPGETCRWTRTYHFAAPRQ